MDIVVTLSPVQLKALAYVAYSPEEWIQNVVKARCDSAIQEVAKREVQRMMEDPNVTSIPADKEAIVMACTDPSAKEVTDARPSPAPPQ
jgi:hypothetical protein